MILKRFLRYGIIFLVIVLILSVFSINKHWDTLSIYFANSFALFVEIGGSLLLLGLGVLMIIKLIFK